MYKWILFSVLHKKTELECEQVALLSQRGCTMLPVCLVSFNSTIPRVQSFIISYCGFTVSHCRILSPDKTEWRLISATLCGWSCCCVADQLWLVKRIREEDCGFRFTTAYNYILFCITLRLFVINFSSTVLVNNKRRHLPATSVTNLLCVLHLAVRPLTTRWSQISFENRIFFLPHLHSISSLRGRPLQYIAITFGTEQEVKVIWQKAPHGGPIPRLGVTPGGRKLYHWIPGVGFPISVP